MIARILSGVIGGFFVAFFGYMVLSSPLNEPYVSIFMIIWALSIFYSYKAETAGVVWRFLLLTSSFTSSIGIFELRRRNKNRLLIWMAITLLLGLAFLGMEINEFI